MRGDLPTTAALRGNGSAATAVVLIERDGRAEARTVRLGLRTLDSTEVLEGLAEGDTVLLGTAAQPGKRVRAETQTSVAAPQAKRTRNSTREDAGSALGNAMGR